MNNNEIAVGGTYLVTGPVSNVMVGHNATVLSVYDDVARVEYDNSYADRGRVHVRFLASSD